MGSTSLDWLQSIQQGHQFGGGGGVFKKRAPCVLCVREHVCLRGIRKQAQNEDTWVCVVLRMPTFQVGPGPRGSRGGTKKRHVHTWSLDAPLKKWVYDPIILGNDAIS